MLYEDTDSTILLRRTQTQTAATSFQHGGLPQRQSCCSLVTHHGLGSRSMPREEAFSMEGYHNASLALHRMHHTSVACLYSPNRGNKRHEILRMHQHFGGLHLLSSSNRGNKQREIQRAHTRETCAPCDSDVDVCSPSCRGNFNKTTSCTWPRTSSTCATTSS